MTGELSAEVAILAVVGLVVGSFLGVVIDRVPESKSIVRPPSHCPSCEHPIRAVDNIPVLSYLVLRGRCRDCRALIPPHDLVVELVTAAGFAAVAVRVHPLELWPAYLVLVSGLVALSAIDIARLRLPTPIIFATALLGGVLLVGASALSGEWFCLVRAVGGAAIGFGVFFAIFFAVPRGMGFGDVRLAALCGGFLGYLGYDEIAVGLLGSFVVGGLVALSLVAARRVGRRSALPFGPFLATGTVIAVLFGPTIARVWLG